MTATALCTAAFRPAAAALYRFVIIGKDGWLFPIWDTLHTIDRPMIKLVSELVNTATGMLKQAGITTVLAVTPAKSRIYADFLPSDQQMSRDVEPRYQLALEALQPSGALLPDLLTLMADDRRAAPEDQLFFKHDTHWTPEGAALTAVGIGKQIASQVHLPDSTTPGSQLGPAVTLVADSGDLSALLPPDMASQYPPEPYRAWKAIETAGLLDDDSADVAVVGNSYMHPRWEFAALLSNQLGRPVSLDWKVHSYGPYATLLNYLQGETFKKQRPKVLLWTFHEVDMQTSPNSADVWGANAMMPAAFLADLQKALAV